jgi:multidrug transporter EmrE-like cation transporter
MNAKNRVIPIATVVVAVCFNLLGTIFLKMFADSSKNLYSVLVFVILIGFTFSVRIISWLMIGRWFQLSYIYPFMSINYVLAFIVGILVFSEPYGLNKMIGSCMITAGVILISFSPHKTEKMK